VLPGALADFLDGDCILCWLMKLLIHPKKKEKCLNLKGEIAAIRRLGPNWNII
jgi:hypothetical protein